MEARNGHIKSFLEFFQQVVRILHVPNLGDLCRRAAAIINRYHPLIPMEGADAKIANEFFKKSKEPNVVQALVGVEKLHTRNAQRLLDFPVLTLQSLKKITIEWSKPCGERRQG